MAEPQTDVSRPSALPTANFLQRGTASQSLVDQNSAEYLDTIEEEWNKKVDLEVETLLDGMVDLVGLASIGDKDKFRIAQESFQAQTRAESMVCSCLLRGPTRYNAAKGSRGKLSAFNHSFYETAFTPL
jgi:mediator of RNA polymerase II transcription subunit 22